VTYLYGGRSSRAHRLNRPAASMARALRVPRPVITFTVPPGRYVYQTGTASGPRPPGEATLSTPTWSQSAPGGVQSNRRALG
jgi:hypothetical protein